MGLSEVSSSALRRANGVHPISAVQIEYNPWTLDPEEETGTYLLNTCKELDVSVFCYSPLGRGLLTGRYRSVDDFDESDARRNIPRFQGENFAKNLVIVDKFKEMSQSKGYTPSQLALAWLVAQGDNIFVIPGTKKIKYLEENIGAAHVSLTTQEEQEVRNLVSEAAVEGSRGIFCGAYVDTAPLNA